jgi:hypothetical protein
MSEIYIASIPKTELYWTKQELADREFAERKRLDRVKSEAKKQETYNRIIEIIDSIRRIENRMEILGI